MSTSSEEASKQTERGNSDVSGDECCERHPGPWSRPSAPWRPERRSAPGRTPAPGASGGTWQPALPAAGRCPRTGWERRLRGKELHFKKWTLNIRIIDDLGKTFLKNERSPGSINQTSIFPHWEVYLYHLPHLQTRRSRSVTRRWSPPTCQ